MENSVFGHATPAAGDVGGALTAAESGTGIWDGDLGRGEETLFRQSEIFPGNLLTNSGKSCIIYSLSIGGWVMLPIGKMRGWRNWQTRTFEGRVVHTIRVRFPFLAPPFHGARVS